MKKIILVIAIIAILFIGAAIYLVYNFKSPSVIATYNIGGKNYRLLEAKIPSQWVKGLMFYKNRNELKGADGMMFIFPTKQIQSFWNENTYLNLNLYWMDGEEVIGKSYLPSILRTKEPLTVSSPGMVDRVAEIVE